MSTSTADLLERSVQIAGLEVKPQIGTLEDELAQVKAIPEGLRTEEEKELLKVANATAKSLPLINITVAIKAGGRRDDGYPNLAIAPYERSINRQRVNVRVEIDGEVSYSDGERMGWRISFPVDTLPAFGGLWARLIHKDLSGSTTIPLVPPSLRQENTEGVVLLYEASAWDSFVVRPVDPYLLRKVAGSIYVVLGTWNITEREIAAYQAAWELGI